MINIIGKYKQQTQYPFRTVRIGSFLLAGEMDFFTSEANRVYPVKTIYLRKKTGGIK